MNNAPSFFKGLIVFVLFFHPLLFHGQAVTGVITDLNGFWKSSVSNTNSNKPDNNHNLLAFTYNNTQYSTGVDDAKLSAKGEQFTPCDFWCLPVASSRATSANTKVGVGAAYDGVPLGPSNPTPANDIALYLTDGIKALNIGTCIANLPAGNLDFFASNVNPLSIGDGIPDIVVTQVADPSGNSFDRYEFTDNNGARVGNFKDIVFTNITPVGTWTADFYDPNQNPMVLTPGFTRTDRPIRLWAADLSDFGITTSNLSRITKFRVKLSGNSDIAFVAYNQKSFNVSIVLPVTLSSFRGTAINNKSELNWQTNTQTDNSRFIVERSDDGKNFFAIGNREAHANANNYSFIDNSPLPGRNFYRLKLVDENGHYKYSSVIQINLLENEAKMIYRPLEKNLIVTHDKTSAVLSVYNVSGILIKSVTIQPNNLQTEIDLRELTPGIHIAAFESINGRLTKKFCVN